MSKSNKACSISLIWSEREAGIDSISLLSDSTPYINDIVISLLLVVFPNVPSYPLQESRDGDELGDEEGSSIGLKEGTLLGIILGTIDGPLVGFKLGSELGESLGFTDGIALGIDVGSDEGIPERIRKENCSAS